MDKAHKYTDKQIEKLEKEIKKVYKSTLDNLNKELEKVLVKIDLTQDPKKLYPKLMKEKRIKSLIQRLTNELNQANKIAVQIMNNELIEVYGYNHNWEAYSLEKELGYDLNFTVFNKQTIKAILQDETNPFALIALDDLEDKADIIKRLRRELLSGLLAGESISKIAKRIENVTNKKRYNSIRIARTETTRVQNSARYDVMKHAEKQGLKISKRWISTLDTRTRSSHKHLNNETVGLNDTFSNGLEFPGDPKGHVSEVVNCRCTMITEFDGFEKSKEELKLEEVLKNKEFEVWVKEHEV